MKIINVVGARPNFIKIAPLMDAYQKFPCIHPILLHTGQHYDDQMSDLFFKELNIPEPNICLNIGSGSHANQVAMIMKAFESVCLQEKPDAVLVVGDVNSTLACSLVASKLKIKIIHLEAGLRSFDRTMPEEINRVVTDTLADLLLTPSKDAGENLINEGICTDKIHFVGNIMIDTLYKFQSAVEKSLILGKLALETQNYILVTMHRPGNVDDPINLKKILQCLRGISLRIKIVLPLHPRTLKNITSYKLASMLENLIVTEPLGYVDFQQLMTKAKLIITDSGGIQEETTALNIPCITLRENTERPITVSIGSNILVGNNMNQLNENVGNILNGNWKQSSIPKYWDGKTSERILKVLLKYIT